MCEKWDWYRIWLQNSPQQESQVGMPIPIFHKAVTSWYCAGGEGANILFGPKYKEIHANVTLFCWCDAKTKYILCSISITYLYDMEPYSPPPPPKLAQIISICHCLIIHGKCLLASHLVIYGHIWILDAVVLQIQLQGGTGRRCTAFTTNQCGLPQTDTHSVYRLCRWRILPPWNARL